MLALSSTFRIADSEQSVHTVLTPELHRGRHVYWMQKLRIANVFLFLPPARLRNL